MKNLKTIFIALVLIVNSFSFIHPVFAGGSTSGSCIGAREYDSAIGKCKFIDFRNPTTDCPFEYAPMAVGEVTEINNTSNCGCICYYNPLIPYEIPSEYYIIALTKLILILLGFITLVFLISTGIKLVFLKNNKKSNEVAKARVKSGAILIVILSFLYFISDFVIKTIVNIIHK